eukprot:Ihof_evm2s213 gene=Ihof_evmTU2s213
MGNALPPQDLTDLLGQGYDYDLIVVGAQEADYKRKAKGKNKKGSPTSIHDSSSYMTDGDRFEGDLSDDVSNSDSLGEIDEVEHVESDTEVKAEQTSMGTSVGLSVGTSLGTSVGTTLVPSNDRVSIAGCRRVLDRQLSKKEPAPQAKDDTNFFSAFKGIKKWVKAHTSKGHERPVHDTVPKPEETAVVVRNRDLLRTSAAIKVSRESAPPSRSSSRSHKKQQNRDSEPPALSRSRGAFDVTTPVDTSPSENMDLDILSIVMKYEDNEMDSSSTPFEVPTASGSNINISSTTSINTSNAEATSSTTNSPCRKHASPLRFLSKFVPKSQFSALRTSIPINLSSEKVNLSDDSVLSLTGLTDSSDVSEDDEFEELGPMFPQDRYLDIDEIAGGDQKTRQLPEENNVSPLKAGYRTRRVSNKDRPNSLRHEKAVDSTATPIGTPSKGPSVVESAHGLLKTTDKYHRYRRKWFNRVISAMGDDYVVVKKNELMEMRLIGSHPLSFPPTSLFLCHKRIRHAVSTVKRSKKATGVGSVVGNKGGVSIGLKVATTSFCFVSAHLAAHEGERYRTARNNDIAMIWQGLGTRKTKLHEVYNSYDYVFFMGDLNYRLDLPRTVQKAGTWDQKERWSYAVDLVEKKAYNNLLMSDELVHQMSQGKILYGFKEGTIEFPPTFKVERHKTGLHYMDTRVPAYCDRILWYAPTGLWSSITQTKYQSVVNYSTSDHKPVYGQFTIDLQPTSHHVYGGGRLYVTFDISRMVVHAMPQMHTRRPTIPHGINQTDPTSRLRKTKSMTTTDNVEGMSGSLYPREGIVSQKRSISLMLGRHRSLSNYDVRHMGNEKDVGNHLTVRFIGPDVFYKRKRIYHTKKTMYSQGDLKGEWSYEQLPAIECNIIDERHDMDYQHILGLVWWKDALGAEFMIGQFVMPMRDFRVMDGAGEIVTRSYPMTKSGRYRGQMVVSAALLMNREQWR